LFVHKMHQDGMGEDSCSLVCLPELEASIKEVEKGTAKTYTMEEVWEHLGFEKEEQDETADELQHAINKAMVEYNQYQKKKELQTLIDSL